MDANNFAVTMGEYNGFHAIDRVLYSVLAVELWHDPLLAVQILSLWLWLEQLGFKNFVDIIMSLPVDFINELANEAITCLSCIKNPEIMVQADTTELPLTSRFLKRKICILIMLRNREVVLRGISKIVDVCAISLRDAVDDAIKTHRARGLLHKMKTLSPAAIEKSLINKFANLGLGSGGRNCSTSSIQPPVPVHQPVNRFFNSMHVGETPQGGIVDVRFQSGQPVVSRSSNLGFFGGSGLSRNGGSDIPTSTLPPEERTMFVTFSKGYSVSEAELTDFFYMAFADCIESFHMQKVRSGEQALYARVVFRFPYVIDLILKGLPKAKFTINGKHLWMRKFIPRRATTGFFPAPAAAPAGMFP